MTQNLIACIGLREMGLDVFYATYRVDGHRRPAYERSMMA
jgi:hypothetical protein